MSDASSAAGWMEQLVALMPPPPLGDSVDWDALYRRTGTWLPRDYREFVAIYGGGSIDDHMEIMIPPAPGYPYGSYWQEAPGILNSLVLGGSAPDWVRSAAVLPYGGNGEGDQIYWWCESINPDKWETVIFKRQHKSGEPAWRAYHMGMVEFWVRAARGDLEMPFSLRNFPSRRPVFINWKDDQ